MVGSTPPRVRQAPPIHNHNNNDDIAEDDQWALSVINANDKDNGHGGGGGDDDGNAEAGVHRRQDSANGIYDAGGEFTFVNS